MVELTIKLVPFEPDGSECEACGDTIFLEGKKMIFVVAGRPKLGKKVGELDYRFCQSCGDALESGMEGGAI